MYSLPEATKDLIEIPSSMLVALHVSYISSPYSNYLGWFRAAKTKTRNCHAALNKGTPVWPSITLVAPSHPKGYSKRHQDPRVETSGFKWETQKRGP